MEGQSMVSWPWRSESLDTLVAINAGDCTPPSSDEFCTDGKPTTMDMNSTIYARPEEALSL